MLPFLFCFIFHIAFVCISTGFHSLPGLFSLPLSLALHTILYFACFSTGIHSLYSLFGLSVYLYNLYLHVSLVLTISTVSLVSFGLSLHTILYLHVSSLVSTVSLVFGLYLSMKSMYLHSSPQSLQSLLSPLVSLSLFCTCIYLPFPQSLHSLFTLLWSLSILYLHVSPVCTVFFNLL